MAEEISKVDHRRNFIGPDGETKYYLAAPTAEDIRGADWTYSKMFTKSLVEGITTSSEMMDILTRRGVIGPEFEQRSAELADNLNRKIFLLDLADNVDTKRQLSIDVARAREELFQWNQRLNGPMSNTCEQIADDARLEFLTAAIIQKEDGSKVWDSYDTFLKEKSQGLALKSRFEVMLYLQGMDSNFLDKTPEALAMKEVEEEVTAQAEAALQAAQAVAEEEAKLHQLENNVSDDEESDTKKVVRKKKPSTK